MNCFKFKKYDESGLKGESSLLPGHNRIRDEQVDYFGKHRLYFNKFQEDCLRGVDSPVIAIDTTSKVNARTKEDGFGVTAVHKLNVFENTTGVTIGSAITSSGTTGADISGMKMLQGIASIMTEDQKDNVLIYADKPVQEYNAFAKSGILPDYSLHIPNFQFPLDQIVIVTTEVGCDTACAALLAAKLPVMFDSETFYDPATKQNSHVANLVQLYTGKGGAGSNDICYLFQVHAWPRVPQDCDSS